MADTIDLRRNAIIATGATAARTLANRFAEVPCPEDFGAIGDGTTDCLAAFNAASTAIGIGGVLRLLPGKVYLLSGQFAPARRNQTVYLNGSTIKAGTNIGASVGVVRAIRGTQILGKGKIDGNALNQSDNVVMGINAGSVSATVTISIASPGEVTWAGHNFEAGDRIVFETTGALPTGLTAGVKYFVLSAGLAASTFRLAATAEGTAINTSGTQSGTHTGRAIDQFATVDGVEIVNAKYGGIISHNACYTTFINNRIVVRTGDGHLAAYYGIFQNDFSTPGFGLDNNVINDNYLDLRGLAAADTSNGIIYKPVTGAMGVAPEITGNRVFMPEDPSTTGMVALEAWYSRGAIVSGNFIHGGRIGMSLAGLDASVVSDNNSRASKSYNYELAIGCDNLQFTGNMADGTLLSGTALTEYGIAIQGTACTHLNIVGNTVRDAKIDGIRLHTSDHDKVTIRGNDVRLASGATGYGITAGVVGNDLVISDNTVEGNGTTDLSGIRVLNASRAEVTNNKVRNFAAYAISIQSTAVAETDITESGNTQTGCASGLIQWSASGSGSFGSRCYRRSGTRAQRPTGLGTDDAGFVYHDTDVTGPVTWNGSAWKAQPVILARSAPNYTPPADTAENDAVSVTVPANAPGPNGRLEITYMVSGITNNANVKTIRTKLGAGQFEAYNAASINSARRQIIIQNLGATNSQASQASSATSGGWLQMAVDVTTGAIDTTVNQTLKITLQKATAGDALTLLYWQVILYAD